MENKEFKVQSNGTEICECLMCDANDMWMNRCFRVSNKHDDANDIYCFNVKATLCVVCVFNWECFFYIYIYSTNDVRCAWAYGA